MHQRAPKTRVLPGPLSGPWTPAERTSRFALVMRAHSARKNTFFHLKIFFLKLNLILFLKVTGWQLCTCSVHITSQSSFYYCQLAIYCLFFFFFCRAWTAWQCIICNLLTWSLEVILGNWWKAICGQAYMYMCTLCSTCVAILFQLWGFYLW